jgi:hypothetical protein
MASPFQPLKAQATTGRPVKGLTTIPTLGSIEPTPQLAKSGGPRPPAPGVSKSFAQPTPNKSAGSFTHEQRGGVAPSAVTQGIHSHDIVPHIRMK